MKVRAFFFIVCACLLVTPSAIIVVSPPALACGGMIETPNGPEAENPCPPGQGNNNSEPSKADVWGAIAVSPTTLYAISSRNYGSEQAAKIAALKACSVKGARDCVIAVTVADTCVALAISKAEKIRAVGGPTGALNFATGNAMLHCQRAGGRSCQIATDTCADGIDHEISLPQNSVPFGRRM
jgi:hypothetical protein